MKRAQWLAVLFAFAVFGCGVVSGVLLDRYATTSVVSAKSSDDFRHQYISEMKTKLNLSEDQLARLDVILDETKANFKKVRDEDRPQIEKIKEQQVQRVKSILNASQIPAYDQLVADRQHRFHEQEKRDRDEDVARAAAHRARLAK